MRTLIIICFLILSTPLNGCNFNADKLSRDKAEDILLKREFTNVYIRVKAACKSDEGALLIKHNYAIEPKRYHNSYIQLQKPIMPYYIKTIDGKFEKFVVLAAGKVKKAISTGISNIDKSNKIVEFEIEVNKNEIGKLIGIPSKLNIVTRYQLYDNGWRFKEILWDKTVSISNFNKNKLHSFYTDEGYLNAVLWNMHELGIYSNNYMHFLKKLEKSNKCLALDTVAWVYKDNGQKDKAIKIYKNRILPAVKAKGGNVQEYQNYLTDLMK